MMGKDHEYAGKGGAECPMPIPDDLAPKGDPKVLNADGAGKMGGDMSEADKALAAFAGLKGGTKLSSITASGKAKIPTAADNEQAYTNLP